MRHGSMWPSKILLHSDIITRATAFLHDAPLVRSLFQDLPNSHRPQAPASVITSGPSIPTLRSEPSQPRASRSPEARLPQGRPLNTLEEADLEGLPTFAAFRRSAVVTATSAVTQRLPAALAPQLTFTAAPAPTTNQRSTTAPGMEAREVRQAWEAPQDGQPQLHGSTVQIRPLPTQFQPRSLGHASQLVQYSGVRERLQDRALHSGIYCEPQPVAGGTAASTSPAAAEAWGGPAFSALGAAAMRRSPPPPHTSIKGGSLSLAAHVAAATRKSS